MKAHTSEEIIQSMGMYITETY